MSCGVVCRHGSDLALLWLWCRLVAAGPIRPLVWEPPCDQGPKRAGLLRRKGNYRTGERTASHWEPVSIEPLQRAGPGSWGGYRGTDRETSLPRGDSIPVVGDAGGKHQIISDGMKNLRRQSQAVWEGGRGGAAMFGPGDGLGEASPWRCPVPRPDYWREAAVGHPG